MIGGRRPLKGRKPADRRVRVERPHSPYFRYTGPGQLVAKAAAPAAEDRPRAGRGRGSAAVAIGRPLASEEETGERLSKKKALAIFSSDAISSSAYATEEIIRVLVARRRGGPRLLGRRLDRDRGPAGGRRDLVPPGLPGLPRRRRRLRGRPGEPRPARSGLVAAAALLIDYVMTVAVSTASAIGQIVSVVPELDPVRIEIAVAVIALITIANLRGLRESGNIFAIPTYAFLGLALLMVGLGVVNIVTGARPPDRHAERRGVRAAAPSCRSSCCSRRSPAARSP